MDQNKNWNCDNDKCQKPDGEIRTLPLGGGANILVCYDCYLSEIAYRRERNRTLDKSARFDLPAWGLLDIYNTEG
jgi:hypothetical protein